MSEFPPPISPPGEEPEPEEPPAPEPNPEPEVGPTVDLASVDESDSSSFAVSVMRIVMEEQLKVSNTSQFPAMQRAIAQRVSEAVVAADPIRTAIQQA